MVVPSASPQPPQLVSELFDSALVAWDRIKLQECFTQANIDVILNNPLCHRRQPDFWAWHHDKMGVFTVRSAYRMLIMQRALSENAVCFVRRGVVILVAGHGALKGMNFLFGGSQSTHCHRHMFFTTEIWLIMANGFMWSP